jgi:hypothetical protein
MAKTLRNRLLKAFLRRGKSKAFSFISSEQLRAGLASLETSDSTGKLNVPHYWAKYYHDGRGPSKGSPILVWFRNPKDDPRTPGGRYPVTKAQVRRLSKGEFRKWSSINNKIISAYKRNTGKRLLTSSDYRAMELPMIIAKNSPRNGGRVAAVQAFFSNQAGGGMDGFREDANIVGSHIVSNYVTAQLKKSGFLHKKITRTVKI